MTRAEIARLLRIREHELPEGYASHEGIPLVRVRNVLRHLPVLQMDALDALIAALEYARDEAAGSVEQWAEDEARRKRDEQLFPEPDEPPEGKPMWLEEMGR